MIIRIANRGVLQLPTGDDGKSVSKLDGHGSGPENAKKGPKVGQVLPSGKHTKNYGKSL